MNPASFQAKSSNRKLAPVLHEPREAGTYRNFRILPQRPFCSSTYVSIHGTCPDTCVFKTRGCFATAGYTAVQQRRLDAAAEGLSGLEVAQHETTLIDGSFTRGVPQDGARGGRDLRLHVGGDVANTESARMLGGAAERWKARGGGSVWTFTHRWRSIAREVWNPISVLASVETTDQVQQARSRGYAAALVVPEFPEGDRAFSVGGLVKAIPCPAETRGTTCVECRLCLDQPLHKLQRAIAFQVHGNQAGRAMQALEDS